MGEDDRFLVKQWLDGSVVFDRQFGNTHALDPAAAAIFLAFKSGERGQAEMIATLSPFYPDATKQEMTDRLDALFEQLTMLGIPRVNTH